LGPGKLTRSQMENSSCSSQATAFRSDPTSCVNSKAVRFHTGKEAISRRNYHCHWMTLLFRDGLGIQEAKSSKDATEALEFYCLVKNTEGLLSVSDLAKYLAF